MAKRIVWQPKPIRQMREIEHYFVEELSSVQAYNNLLDLLYEKLARIADYPESGQMTGRKYVRYVRVDEYRSVFYRIRRTHLQIILIWDARQDPDKNPYKKSQK